jgi:hypothetical protein
MWVTALSGKDLVGRALGELEARARTEVVPEGLPFSHDAASLARASMWNLQCKYGAFDITFEPAGGGYDHPAQKAKVVAVRGVEMPLADLGDIVESKTLSANGKLIGGAHSRLLKGHHRIFGPSGLANLVRWGLAGERAAACAALARA